MAASNQMPYYVFLYWIKHIGKYNLSWQEKIPLFFGFYWPDSVKSKNAAIPKKSLDKTPLSREQLRY